MKKIINLVLIICMSLFLLSCKEEELDNSPIKIFVGLGNNSAYYETLKPLIEKEIGEEVEYVYFTTDDTSNSIVEQFKNNDLCADIIFTASKTNEEYLKSSCIDLLGNTNITDDFNFQTINEQTCSDGGIYQLPFTTKLIGITYNETLMEENGFTVPKTYEDMLALKKECDERGIKFAVCGGIATGHGFNWLFHLMGSQWLNGLEGSEWLDDFLNLKTDASLFKEKCAYFEKYVKAGLFGEMDVADWNASIKFSKERALFLYDLTNSVYSYDGPMYLNYKDESSIVDGVTLHDTYKSMPWISEDGTNNCYTYYNNSYAALNVNLAKSNQKNRLEKCLQIMEFLTTKASTDVFVSANKDGYLQTNGFEVSNDALYVNYKQEVKNGYIQPWYYNDFSVDTIVSTGQVVNEYIQGINNVTLDDIIQTLEDSVSNNNNNNICVVSETLDIKDVAKLNAIAGAINLQEKLTENGITDEIEVSLIPYIESYDDWLAFTKIGVISTKLYKGEFSKSLIGTITMGLVKQPVAVYMTGKEIKDFVNNGFNKSKDLGYEISTFPICMVTKNNISLDNNKTYLVAVNENSFTSDAYKQLLTNNKVVLDNESKAITGNTTEGLTNYLTNKKTISKSNIDWK